MNYCQNYNGIARCDKDTEILITRLRCKLWRCEYCSIINAKLWYNEIIRGINNKACKWSFLTITLPSWMHGQKNDLNHIDVALKHIKDSWHKLMKRLKRWLGNFEYVRVIERHTSGIPHIHLLINRTIPDSIQKKRKDGSTYHHSKILLSHLKACKYGYIHDAKNLIDTDGIDWHAGAIAKYCAKYMTKDDASFSAGIGKYHIRKIQTSRGFKAPKNEPENEWRLIYGIWLHDVMNEDKKPIIDINTGIVITSDHFLESVIYPDDVDKK